MVSLLHLMRRIYGAFLYCHNKYFVNLNLISMKKFMQKIFLVLLIYYYTHLFLKVKIIPFILYCLNYLDKGSKPLYGTALLV